jgi:hypothetical protein
MCVTGASVYSYERVKRIREHQLVCNSSADGRAASCLFLTWLCGDCFVAEIIKQLVKTRVILHSLDVMMMMNVSEVWSAMRSKT